MYLQLKLKKKNVLILNNIKLTLADTLSSFFLNTPMGWKIPLRSTNSLSSTFHLKRMGGSSKAPSTMGEIFGRPHTQKGTIEPILNLNIGDNSFRPCSLTTCMSTKSLK